MSYRKELEKDGFELRAVASPEDVGETVKGLAQRRFTSLGVEFLLYGYELEDPRETFYDVYIRMNSPYRLGGFSFEDSVEWSQLANAVARIASAYNGSVGAEIYIGGCRPEHSSLVMAYDLFSRFPAGR